MNHVEKIGELIEREKQRQGEFTDTFPKSQSQPHQTELGASVSLKARVKTAGEATRTNQNFKSYKSAI